MKREGRLDFLPCQLEACLLSITIDFLKKIRKKGSRMYQFCLELKKNPCKGEIPLQTSPSFAPVAQNVGEENQVEKIGEGNNIKLESTIYTPGMYCTFLNVY